MFCSTISFCDYSELETELFSHQSQVCEMECQQKFVLNSVRTETKTLELQRQNLIKEFEKANILIIKQTFFGRGGGSVGLFFQLIGNNYQNYGLPLK
jgi:hypothetical protein